MCGMRDCCEDKENGGVFWSVTYDGKVSDSTKHTYNQAFAIYALSTYYDASGCTEALDSISEKKIQDSIQKLVKGRATLIVAHRLSTIRNADRIAVIGNGNVLESGSYEELMEQKGVFYQMEHL